MESTWSEVLDNLRIRRNSLNVMTKPVAYTYSVVYDDTPGLFRVKASWEDNRSGLIELLHAVSDGEEALQFAELLNVAIEQKYRRLFALSLQSFYTECIAGALASG